MVIDRTRKLISPGQFFLGITLFVAAYALLRVSGMVAPSKGLVQALHEKPPQYALYALVVYSALRIVIKRGRPAPAFFWAGVLMMAGGLVVSSFVRFEGKIVLTEGQRFSGASGEYEEGSIYTARKAAIPVFSLEVNSIAPNLFKNGLLTAPVSAAVSYQFGGAEGKSGTIRSFPPSFYRGAVSLHVTKYGYSPLFRFTDGAGGVLKEFYWPVEIFPAGSEDSLRSLWIPHVFYIQYFPQDIRDKPASASHDSAAPDPVFRLRIVRNLDVVYKGAVGLHQRVSFDGMGLSLEEVRKWVEISVVQDYGMVLFFAGALGASGSLIAGALKRGFKSGAPGGQRQGERN